MRWFTLLLLAFVAPLHAEPLPRPDHVLIVIEENRGFKQMMNPLHRDSYLHALVKRGMLLTQSHGVAHPSQPNYLALFSGSTQGITSNTCPNSFSSDNLATALIERGYSFVSYAEGLLKAGDLGCEAGAYQRKHNPVSNWQGTRLPAHLNQPFTEFPTDFSKLPTVALVVPNQENDMHDGSFAAADDWLKQHIEPYVQWAMQHNSLLILTWDEDDYRQNNHIVTLLVGSMVKAGQHAPPINHYHVLRTVLDFYGATPMGESQRVEPISGVWQTE